MNSKPTYERDDSLINKLTLNIEENRTTSEIQEQLVDHKAILQSIETANTRIHEAGIHKQTFSGKLLDWDEVHFSVEIAIDSDKKKYQTRIFPIELLQDSSLLKHGQLLRIMYFTKKEELRIQIKNGTAFIPNDTFPNENILLDLKSNLFNFDQ